MAVHRAATVCQTAWQALKVAVALGLVVEAVAVPAAALVPFRTAWGADVVAAQVKLAAGQGLVVGVA